MQNLSLYLSVFRFLSYYLDKIYVENLSKKQFQELIIKVHKELIDVQKQLMLDHLENWKGFHDQVDDVLVIGFKYE